MSYYFISFESSGFEGFIKSHTLLRSGTWISSENELSKILSKDHSESVFFIHFDASDSVNKFASAIRKSVIHHKIVFVMNDLSSHDLRIHQMSEAGGDAYVPISASSEIVESILESLRPVLNKEGNRLEGDRSQQDEFEIEALSTLKAHSLSRELDRVFNSVMKSDHKKPKLQSIANFSQVQSEDESGESMSDKDQELSLDDLGDLELGSFDSSSDSSETENGLDLSLDDSSEDDLSLSLGDEDDAPSSLNLLSEEPLESLGGLDLGSMDDFSMEEPTSSNDSVESISETDALDFGSSFEMESSDPETHLEEDSELNFTDSGMENNALSDEAMEKLKEIDAIMVEDSKINISLGLNFSEAQESVEEGDSLLEALNTVQDKDIDEPLVSDDLNLDTLNFGPEDSEAEEIIPEEKPKKKAKIEKPAKEVRETRSQKESHDEFKDISGAYSGEMERTQATISNLRADRDELLAKIQKLEEDKLLQGRQSLTMRAELDEKKIELSIIRRKLNDEISDLKDRMKIQEERKLILEEKNRLLQQELDKAGQKNRIDVNKVQMRERELEGKLELLKSDAETQIRNRDLKILELKRKIDAMEFDMESITTQEKRSVESRFELEDKLDKAIKTLRSAITVLEDESDKGNALEALKKNIDM